jgi:hypothetical protein
MEAVRDGRGDELAAQIKAAEDKHRRDARLIELRIDTCWWGTIVLGGLAVALGFVAPGLKEWPGWTVQPWMVSLVAGASTGLELIRRRRGWRGKSDAFYRAADRFHGLWHRFRYQMPNPPTPDQVADVDREYHNIRRQLGEALSAVNNEVDGPAPKPTPKETDRPAGN